ncbi:hypothetical protein HDU96_002812, partial [Phlyctochytrium bullatum]
RYNNKEDALAQEARSTDENMAFRDYADSETWFNELTEVNLVLEEFGKEKTDKQLISKTLDTMQAGDVRYGYLNALQSTELQDLSLQLQQSSKKFKKLLLFTLPPPLPNLTVDALTAATALAAAAFRAAVVTVAPVTTVLVLVPIHQLGKFDSRKFTIRNVAYLAISHASVALTLCS